MRRILYLASDYDGTFKQNGAVCSHDLDAVRRFREWGGKFGLVTGRAPSQVEEERKRFSFPLDFLVASTGALILDGEGRVIHKKPVIQELVPSLLRDLGEYGSVMYGVNTVKRHCCLHIDPALAAHPRFAGENGRVCTLKEAGRDGEILSLFTDDFDEARAWELYRRLRDSYEGRFAFHYNKGCIDITAPGAGKAQGIRTLGHLRPEAQIHVIGDALNDLEMVREFDGFCVKGSCAELLSAASRRFPHIADCIEFLMGQAARQKP